MSAAARRRPYWQATLLTLAFAAVVAPPLLAQTVTVRTVADVLHVQARGFSFIEGPVLTRLKEGRSVRIDFEMTVLAKPGGQVMKQLMQSFALSFDLWEERFAVSRMGVPPSSISHLRQRDAETWCLENLRMPVSALGIGRDTPFWIRLAYRVQDVVAAAEEQGERYTLRGLIDRLSRRSEEDNLARSIDAGPFRLP
ncbi:MAG TPA: hypothetical protein VFS23_33715 [Vicinamibacterales bacterium]|nr:hypothetical protein [Vicinamibacterales bacterium]